MKSLKSITSDIQQMLMTSPFTQCSIEIYFHPILYLDWNDAFDGSVSKSPYNFKNFDLKEFYILVNGTFGCTQLSDPFGGNSDSINDFLVLNIG